MSALARKMTVYLIKSNYINENKREECIYGLEVILGKMINYLTLLLLSVINKNIFETLIFMIVFFSLRKGTGGFHARSIRNCYIGTVVIYFVAIGVIAPVLTNVPFWMGTVTVCAVIIIFLLAPVNHPNLNLEAKEIEVCRQYSRILAMVIGAVIFIFLILKIILVYISYAAAGLGIDAGFVFCNTKFLKNAEVIPKSCRGKFLIFA